MLRSYGREWKSFKDAAGDNRRPESWINTRIGEVAEDDWLLLDDFEGYCDAVRRQWQRAQIVSVANPEVRAPPFHPRVNYLGKHRLGAGKVLRTSFQQT